MNENDARFFEAFKNHMNQYPLSVLQFVKFLNDDISDTPMETITALYDARNMWASAVESVNV